MEVPKKSRSRRSPSVSPISSDVQHNIEERKKRFSKEVLNIGRFNKTALRSFMTNGKDIEVKLKLENGKSSKKKYRIIDTLGEGLYGITYMALDIDEKKLYVIKFQSKKSAKREIKCLQTVKPICGEYILCYVGHFDYNVESNIYSGIVTDYEENLVTLDEYLIHRQETKKQDLTLDEKENIIQNVRVATDKISGLGVIHNDLHYGNLLWNIGNGPQRGIIKIIDFGLCKFEPNVLNAKRKNDEWIDRLSESLNTFLSNKDKKKLISFEDPRIKDLLTLLEKSNIPKAKAPVESEEDTLTKRIKMLKVPIKSEEDTLAKRIKMLNAPIKSPKEEETLVFDVRYPEIPKGPPKSKKSRSRS